MAKIQIEAQFTGFMGGKTMEIDLTRKTTDFWINCLSFVSYHKQYVSSGIMSSEAEITKDAGNWFIHEVLKAFGNVDWDKIYCAKITVTFTSHKALHAHVEIKE